MAEISTEHRNALPDESFALPKTRQYPIHDAAHTRNAAARLQQAKKAGKVSNADYQKAKAAIAKAAKKFGIDSSFTKKATMDLTPADVHTPGAAEPMRTKRKGLSMRLGFPGGHTVEIMHASHEDGELIYLPGVDVSASAT